MAAGQDTILGTDRVVDALKTKVNDDLAEYFVTQAEVVAARTSTVAATTYASVDTRLEAVETANAALLGDGNGCPVSVNDTTPGFLNGKLVAGEAIDLTEGNDGGDETLTVACEDASVTNKGVSELATSAEAITGTDTARTVTPSALTEVLKAHFLL